MYVRQATQRSNKRRTIAHGSFKFVEIAFLSQLMTASATYTVAVFTYTLYVHIVLRGEKEEVRAETNCLLSGNRENDVATASPFYLSLSASLFPLMKWHKRSLSATRYIITLIVISPSSRCLAPGKAVPDDRLSTGYNNDVVACCNRHASLLTAQCGVFFHENRALMLIRGSGP